MSTRRKPAGQRRLTAEARRELIEEAATELFAQHGYHGAGMDAIAARAGVSVPVLYDHFPSKQALHRRLLERHFADLRAIWSAYARDDTRAPGRRLADAIDAWFGYVESHPFAWRMLFRETTGDPEVEALHRQVAAGSRAALLPLVSRELGDGALRSPVVVEMIWEVFRAVLQGLALWWYEHREVSRQQVVAVAMSALWLGFERVQRGELWQP